MHSEAPCAPADMGMKKRTQLVRHPILRIVRVATALDGAHYSAGGVSKHISIVTGAQDDLLFAEQRNEEMVDGVRSITANVSAEVRPRHGELNSQ